jgi:hypothetical protein
MMMGEMSVLLVVVVVIVVDVLVEAARDSRRGFRGGGRGIGGSACFVCSYRSATRTVSSRKGTSLVVVLPLPLWRAAAIFRGAIAVRLQPRSQTVVVTVAQLLLTTKTRPPLQLRSLKRYRLGWFERGERQRDG